MRAPNLEIQEDPEWNQSTSDVETPEGDDNLAEGRLISNYKMMKTLDKFSPDTTEDNIALHLDSENLEQENNYFGVATSSKILGSKNLTQTC